MRPSALAPIIGGQLAEVNARRARHGELTLRARHSSPGFWMNSVEWVSMEGSIPGHLGEQAMESEPASEKQCHYLRSLLHTRGVRDGDCQPLIEAVYPNGLSKREASEEIEKLKYLNGLPARWIHAYVRQLRQRRGLSVEAVIEYLEVACDGATQPAGLSRLQQQELMAWICHPDRRTPTALVR